MRGSREDSSEKRNRQLEQKRRKARQARSQQAYREREREKDRIRRREQRADPVRKEKREQEREKDRIRRREQRADPVRKEKEQLLQRMRRKDNAIREIRRHKIEENRIKMANKRRWRGMTASAQISERLQIASTLSNKRKLLDILGVISLKGILMDYPGRTGYDYKSLEELVGHGLIETLLNINKAHVRCYDVTTATLIVLEGMLGMKVYYRDWTRTVCIRARQCGWCKRILDILKESDSKETATIRSHAIIVLADLIENDDVEDIIIAEEQLLCKVLLRYTFENWIAAKGCKLLRFIVKSTDVTPRRGLCRFLMDLMRRLPDEPYWTHYVAVEALMLLSVLVTETNNKCLLLSLGLESVLMPYVESNRGSSSGKRYKLGMGVACRVFNLLVN
jgi:hypothetical protein